MELDPRKNNFLRRSFRMDGKIHSLIPGSSPLSLSLSAQILQLEKRLQGQFSLRHALEQALGFRSSTVDASGDNLMPKVPHLKPIFQGGC